MIDIVVHKWLRIPYPLHVQHNRNVAHPRATVLFIHGIGNSGLVWDEVVNALPSDIRCISIDLLGFGNSPQPSWAMYSAKTQANSVLTTLLKLRLSGKIIIVGHSLGALVAVEIAKRYPLLVSSLILCSPPFYQPDKNGRSLLPSGDKMIKSIFRMVQKHPQHFVAISNKAKKYGFVHEAFNLSKDNVTTYMNALDATIINQSSMADASRLKIPTTIIHGVLDPVVPPHNLKELALINPRIELIDITAGHEVRGRFIPALVNTVEKHIRFR